jgi:hypothetical protein
MGFGASGRASRLDRDRHCERSEAIQGNVVRLPLLDRRVAIARRRASFDVLWLLAMTIPSERRTL